MAAALALDLDRVRVAAERGAPPHRRPARARGAAGGQRRAPRCRSRRSRSSSLIHYGSGARSDESANSAPGAASTTLAGFGTSVVWRVICRWPNRRYRVSRCREAVSTAAPGFPPSALRGHLFDGATSRTCKPLRPPSLEIMRSRSVSGRPAGALAGIAMTFFSWRFRAGPAPKRPGAVGLLEVPRPAVPMRDVVLGEPGAAAARISASASSQRYSIDDGSGATIAVSVTPACAESCEVTDPQRDRRLHRHPDPRRRGRITHGPARHRIPARLRLRFRRRGLLLQRRKQDRHRRLRRSRRRRGDLRLRARPRVRAPRRPAPRDAGAIRHRDRLGAGALGRLEGVCQGQRHGRFYPGDEGTHYFEDPGEAFAESFAHYRFPEMSIDLALQPGPATDAASFPRSGKTPSRPGRGESASRSRGAFRPGGRAQPSSPCVRRSTGRSACAQAACAGTAMNWPFVAVPAGSSAAPTTASAPPTARLHRLRHHRLRLLITSTRAHADPSASKSSDPEIIPAGPHQAQPFGGVAQLVRALACHARGRGFESRRSRDRHPPGGSGCGWRAASEAPRPARSRRTRLRRTAARRIRAARGATSSVSSSITPAASA